MRQRLILIDLARTLALAGMVVFHLTWDLDMAGFVPRGTAVSGFFWYFARIVAGSFIFLAGMGLWISHGEGIRWPAFGRRLAKIAAAAALVSAATYLAMPEVWIFYGILHSIAVSSILGLLFLRLPAAVNLALAALIFALPWFFSAPFFGGVLVWTGLSGTLPLTADFEPLFPWFAPFLAGMATARLFARYGVWSRIEPRETPLLRRLGWPGRHSLAIYLLHQPLLIGLVLSAAWLFAA
ncbi:heparan-alpha-glucosaminide N-acetyltransferase [Pseudogemmobacter humi]|nr:heparan-alpha-glucosaminide N-acetyltransferase [Pseudogemmobacter humi]